MMMPSFFRPSNLAQSAASGIILAFAPLHTFGTPRCQTIDSRFKRLKCDRVLSFLRSTSEIPAKRRRQVCFPRCAPEATYCALHWLSTVPPPGPASSFHTHTHVNPLQDDRNMPIVPSHADIPALRAAPVSTDRTERNGFLPPSRPHLI